MPTNTSLRNHPDFHRYVARSLLLEWQVASWRLPDEMRAGLREPGIALRPFASTLGQWVPAPVREIRLRETLVTDHPWYAVVDVLKHEMAHQIANEIFGNREETDHGPAFRKACRHLGANPAASGSYPTLDQVVLGEASSEQDRIMAKIRKLLALADSPNRHEAERAMAKATQLMARHDVDPEQAPDHHYVTICLGEPRLRHGLHMHALTALVRDACFVKTIWVPMAVPEKQKLGRALEVSGTREHVQMAHYVYDFVRRVIEVEWARHRRGRRLGRNGRRDFALGLIDGFRDILDKQAESSPEIQALIRRGDPELDAYYQQRHPHIRTTRAGRGTTVDPNLLQKGKETARRVGFRPGIDPMRGKERRRLQQ